MREQDEEATVPPPDFSFDFAKTFQAFFKNTVKIILKYRLLRNLHH